MTTKINPVEIAKVLSTKHLKIALNQVQAMADETVIAYVQELLNRRASVPVLAMGRYSSLQIKGKV